MLVPRHRFTELNTIAITLQLGSYRSEILGWGFFEPRWWRNYLHIHSYFEICYVFQGEGIFRSAQTDYTVHTGEVFIARPGDVHEIISSESAPLGIYFWSYSLVPTGLNSATDERVQAVDALLEAFLATKQVTSTRTPAMLRTLELLTEEMVLREAGYTQVIEGLVTKLVLDTARAVVDEPALVTPEKVARSYDESVVQTIVRYLRDNYNRSLSIRDLAAQVHLSERHTSRLFHKVMGCTIMDYLTSLRLEIAAQRLVERQASIKEIAQEIGYPDVRYFITLFRQHMGLTPAVFRQQGGTRFLAQS